jgi:hypothetical protein
MKMERPTPNFEPREIDASHGVQKQEASLAERFLQISNFQLPTLNVQRPTFNFPPFTFLPPHLSPFTFHRRTAKEPLFSLPKG